LVTEQGSAGVFQPLLVLLGPRDAGQVVLRDATGEVVRLDGPPEAARVSGIP
jgi:hypothetical protein